MSLLHPALLSGLGLAIIPILLHLLLRAKPKRLIFPALRLIQQSNRQNVRRMQLRHLWLLLLRIVVILLIVFALTRPSLPAANYSLVWYEWVLLFLIAGLSLGSYFGVMSWWKRRTWPRNELLTRRTMLRGAVGGATILLMLLGVAWPYARRVAAEIKAPAPHTADNIPVAAAFLFDTSPSMGYRQGNQSRLQRAQQIARDHLSRLPAGSKVAVTGSHEGTAAAVNKGAGNVPQELISLAFSLDLQAARNRIDGLDIKAISPPLNERLRTSLQSQEDDRRRVTAEQSGPEEKRQDRYLREIYLFTDLTRSAWREQTSSILRDELSRLKFVSVYLIDVGETSPSNVSLSGIKLARETVPVGGIVKVEANVMSVGNVKQEQTIEFSLAGEDGKLVKKGQQSVTLEPGVERPIAFEAPSISGRYQQGELRIVGSDPLSIDDVGFFTVQTLPQLKVLIVAESHAVARYWQSALDFIANDKITDFHTTFLPATRLSTAELTSFDVICLINVRAPDEVSWTRLHDYVESGGGLSIFLGANSSATTSKARSDQINPVTYNTKTAQTVLPAELKASIPLSPAQTMDLRGSQHTLLKRLEEFNALTELGAIDIRRCWKAEPQETAIVVAKFSGARPLPALVERRLGQGRVMLMSTAVDNVDWNDFVGTPWYFVFADQLMQYLSQQASIRCNHVVGSEVSLPLDHDRKLRKAVIRMPDLKQRPQEIPADAKSLLLRDLSAVGSYQVDSTEGDVKYHTGFSLNLPAQESDLRRLEPQDLDALLGEGRYTVNRDPSSLERNVQAGRLGQEVYGIVVALLVAVFAMEQFTATWFYRTDA